MFKENMKEFLLSIFLVGIILFLVDFSGDFFARPITEELIFSEWIIIIGLLVMVVPALIGTMPSGYLLAKKGKTLKEIMLVPGIGAGIAAFLYLLTAAVYLIIQPDAYWQEQFNQVALLGVDYFSNFTLEEFKAITISSTFIGALFMGVFNFALGAAGGFIGQSLIALKKKDLK